MATLGERLKEERTRLEMNQTAFGSIGGVSKETQINYESGKREPTSSYLAAIAKIGADVTYILTGVRMQPIAPPPPPAAEELSQQEKVIVAKLRMLDPRERDEIEDLVEKVEQAKTAKVKIEERYRKAS